MTPSAHDLRGTLDVTLDNVPLNDAQRLELFNPDPEVNSLAEDIVALRLHGVPNEEIRRLLRRVGAVIALNGEEGDNTKKVAQRLDDFATAAQRAATCGQLADAPVSLKKLAGQLRPHLAVLRTNGLGLGGARYLEASSAVRRIITTCPASRLASPTMRRQLGDGPHDQLLALAASIDGGRT